MGAVSKRHNPDVSCLFPIQIIRLRKSFTRPASWVLANSRCSWGDNQEATQFWGLMELLKDWACHVPPFSKSPTLTRGTQWDMVLLGSVSACVKSLWVSSFFCPLHVRFGKWPLFVWRDLGGRFWWGSTACPLRELVSASLSMIPGPGPDLDMMVNTGGQLDRI